jgi:hypothetical protein
MFILTLTWYSLFRLQHKGIYLHYWKCRFPCRFDTDREMPMTDRKIRKSIFFSWFTDRKTPLGIKRQKNSIFLSVEIIPYRFAHFFCWYAVDRKMMIRQVGKSNSVIRSQQKNTTYRQGINFPVDNQTPKK